MKEQKAENSAETELTPEQKYIQTGKELGYGKDDHDDPSAIEGFEFIDTPAYIDNSQSDTDKDAAEELSEEEVVAGFEFETEKVEPEESYLEDVPMFKREKAGKTSGYTMTIRQAVNWGAEKLRDNNVDDAEVCSSFELLCVY